MATLRSKTQRQTRTKVHVRYPKGVVLTHNAGVDFFVTYPMKHTTEECIAELEGLIDSLCLDEQSPACDHRTASVLRYIIARL